MTRMLGFVTARKLLVAVVLTSFALWPRAACGQESALAQARDYFQAGAQAYAVGEYATAIQAFEQAYRLVPRPAVLFSMAQAERKQYFLDHEPAHLQRAIDLYKRYLEEEPQAGRKADAVQALSELEPLASRVAPADTESKPESREARPAPVPTRVMITAQPSDAIISLDGQGAAPSPMIREIEPGEHVIRATATGYVDTERKVVAVKGALVTVDIELAERPAKLVVNAREGAVLSIDGRVQGQCPFPKPIELSAGSHLITLTLSGYVGLSREQVLVRGQTTIVNAPMPRTVQRTTSLLMLGAAASAVTAGAVFGYFALQQDGSARDFLDSRGKQPLSQTDLDQYDSNKQARDRLRTAALASVGLGAGLGLGGALLIAFDHGDIMTPEADKKASAQRRDAPRIAARPILAPGLAGIDAQLAF